MLELDHKLTLDEDTIKSPNLADRFSEEDRRAIANHLWDGYQMDQSSRSKWLKRCESAMDLAMQISKAKSFPWPDCSNVAFPLLTIGVLQFHSFAYPEIVAGTEVVRYREMGPDPKGEKKALAERIGKHMSYQLLEEDTAWEEQHDRLLINIPVVGCAFKKSFYSGSRGHNVSELVLAKDLVMDYYAKHTDTCARKTHVFPLSRNEIYFRVKTEVFRNVLGEPWYEQPAARPVTSTDDKTRERTGQSEVESDYDTPFTFLEQHCWLDLDGDGYAEPYIGTLEEGSKELVRLVCRFERVEDIVRARDGSILKINATEYFTKYGFIPSPDGSIYDMGFGTLLGPINEAVNALVNQLIDAGTMANTAGGFLARGAKIRSGAITFSPLEWKRVDSTGDDLKKSIFPLPVREPSNVLLQLLQLLIQYANRIPGATEAAAGENPGQNTPAETHRTAVEQSLKLYNAIFKRIWRSMREEFKKLYILNSIYLTDSADGGLATSQDYRGDPTKVAPVADPHILSDSMRMGQAQAMAQRSQVVSGYNKEVVERNFLKALKVENTEAFYPGEGDPAQGKVPPLPNPKMQQAQLHAQIEQQKLQIKAGELKLKMQTFMLDLLEQKKLSKAKIELLEAQATRVLAEVKEEERAHTLEMFKAQLDAMEAHDNSLFKHAELMMQAIGNDYDQSQQHPDGGGVPGMAGAPRDANAAAVSATTGAGHNAAMG